MRHRYSLLPVLVLLALALVVTASYAAKPALTTSPFQGITTRLDAATPQNVNVTCTLGITDAPVYLVNYLLPPDDEYYTLLDPTACQCTGAGGVLLSAAHIYLNFSAACSIPVTVAVVRADLTDPLCPKPIPGDYICTPIAYNLAPAAAGNYNFSLPLNAGCCITGKAFVVITFTGAGSCTTLPKLITSATCNDCTSYNVYPGGFDDLCLDIGFPGNPVINVDGACCDVVPAHTGTWGRLKTMYR
jgi:hypothetical protein